MTFLPDITPDHAAYEATPAFQQYWAAMQEAERMQGVWLRYKERWPPGNEERHACYRAWRASVHAAGELLQVCRKTPEHRAAFGW